MSKTIAVVDCGSSKVSEIGQILNQAGAAVRVVPLEAARTLDVPDACGAVISGGPQLFTQDPGGELLARFSFLDSFTFPVLGICLGHQALALRNGGEVYLGEPRRDSDAVTVRHQSPLFDGLPTHFVVRSDHTEGVTLPPGFRLLASSDFYEVEAMVSMDGRQFGVQFHPEISGPTGERILANFVALVSERSESLD